MSIQSEITRLTTAKADIKAAIEDKGVTVGSETLDQYPSLIEAIPQGSSKHQWTGHVDHDGLIEAGWTEDEIALIQANVCWDEEYDDYYKVDVCEYYKGSSINNTARIAMLTNHNRTCNSDITIRTCVIVSSVALADHLFNGCSSLTSVDVSGFDTSNVTNMSRMFFMDAALRDIDMTGCDTSKVTDMTFMFYQTYNLRELTGVLDMSSVTNTNQMFIMAESLTTISISNLGVALSLSSCTKLSHDSLTYLINHLKTVTSATTLTLGATNLAKLTDDEKQVAIDKGWTLA